jgi:hypothetical protein
MNWLPKPLHIWGLVALLAIALPRQPAVAASQMSREPEPVAVPIREAIACPADLETFTSMLLRDIPSYANRVTQRLYTSAAESRRAGYVLLASAADFEPLTLGPGIYTPTDGQPVEGVEGVVQVFFTTLERQYVPEGFVNFQYHHWLFLTQADQDWRVITMVSQLATVPEGQLLSPPADTGQGVIAQAVRLWLRDCRYRAVEPLEPEHPTESDNRVKSKHSP